tara:strand:+ start:3784 stop:4062 length:279 start_codon:yes stop_codon:yes gene_type:complete
MSSNNKLLEHKICSLEDKISVLDLKLNKIIELLEENVTKNCDKMGNHIDFVENVYNNVKHPLNFVCNKFNYLIGEQKELTIEHNNSTETKIE